MSTVEQRNVVKALKYNPKQFYTFLLCVKTGLPILLPRDLRRLLWLYCREVSSGWLVNCGSLRKMRGGEYYTRNMQFRWCQPLCIDLDVQSLKIVGVSFLNKGGRRPKVMRLICEMDDRISKWLRDVHRFADWGEIIQRFNKGVLSWSRIRPQVPLDPPLADNRMTILVGTDQIRGKDQGGWIVLFGEARVLVRIGHFIPWESLQITACGTKTRWGNSRWNSASLILKLDSWNSIATK